MNKLQNDLDIILNEYEYLKKQDEIGFDNISRMQAQLLASLVKLRKPNSILEIGTSNGYSLFSMLRGITQIHALDTLTIVAVEINSHRFCRVKELREKLQIPYLYCIESDIFSNQTQQEIVNISSTYDFIFIDCNQDKYLELFNILVHQKLIHKNTIICFDNILSHYAAYDFYIQLKRDESFDITLLPLHNGFMIVRYTHSNE